MCLHTLHPQIIKCVFACPGLSCRRYFSINAFCSPTVLNKGDCDGLHYDDNKYQAKWLCHKRLLSWHFEAYSSSAPQWPPRGMFISTYLDVIWSSTRPSVATPLCSMILQQTTARHGTARGGAARRGTAQLESARIRLSVCVQTFSTQAQKSTDRLQTNRARCHYN